MVAEFTSQSWLREFLKEKFSCCDYKNHIRFQKKRKEKVTIVKHNWFYGDNKTAEHSLRFLSVSCFRALVGACSYEFFYVMCCLPQPLSNFMFINFQRKILLCRSKQKHNGVENLSGLLKFYLIFVLFAVGRAAFLLSWVFSKTRTRSTEFFENLDFFF